MQHALRPDAGSSDCEAYAQTEVLGRNWWSLGFTRVLGFRVKFRG